MDVTASIKSFLDALASGAPTPGGGSAAALSGALAAALVAMACRVTMARDLSAAALGETVTRADGLRARLADLAGADARAYEAVLAAQRLPAETRQAAGQAALRRATEVPLEVVAAASDVLSLCERVAQSVRPSTLSDLRVAVALARGTLDGGEVTVRTNLGGAVDPDFAASVRRRVSALAADGRALSERAALAISKRLGDLA